MSTNSKSKISHLDLKKFSMRDRLLAFSSIFAGLTDDKFLFYVPFIERIFKHCLWFINNLFTQDYIDLINLNSNSECFIDNKDF